MAPKPVLWPSVNSFASYGKFFLNQEYLRDVQGKLRLHIDGKNVKYSEI